MLFYWLMPVMTSTMQVNRQSALHNISILCPSFATILKNTYGMPTSTRLFFTGEGEIVEGTTQSDPLAMAITPLIHSFQWMFHRCVMLVMPLQVDNLSHCYIGGNIFWLIASSMQMSLKLAL